MQKQIKQVNPAAFGHLVLEFEDGTKQVVNRGDHEGTPPRPATCGPRKVTSMSRVAHRPAHSERRRNLANNIESIEIFSGENGGHRVVHNFKREAGKKSGAMDGGVYMQRPKPDEHFFGESEDEKVLPHVGKALGLKGQPKLNASNNAGPRTDGADAYQLPLNGAIMIERILRYVETCFVQGGPTAGEPVGRDLSLQ